jgi:hypothetical protein
MGWRTTYLYCTRLAQETKNDLGPLVTLATAITLSIAVNKESSTAEPPGKLAFSPCTDCNPYVPELVPDCNFFVPNCTQSCPVFVTFFETCNVPFLHIIPCTLTADYTYKKIAWEKRSPWYVIEFACVWCNLLCTLYRTWNLLCP